MINDDGQAVLMDLGSAAKARVEIKTRSEAQTLQVTNSESNCYTRNTFNCDILLQGRYCKSSFSFFCLLFNTSHNFSVLHFVISLASVRGKLAVWLFVDLKILWHNSLFYNWLQV